MSASYSKIILAVFLCLAAGACSTFGGGSSSEEVQPIANPFKGYNREAEEQANNLRFRTTHGDSSYEVNVPNAGDSDLVVPFTENGAKSGRVQMAHAGIDYQYNQSKPTMADREIASTFTKSAGSEAEDKRNEIEQGLGLHPEEGGGTVDQSYLAKIDIVKQLFKNARFEAALIELDRLVQQYPNNGRLYEMRGTVLDRLGYTDLAIKSWRQALEFNPNRLGLKKLVEKREQQRNIASERGKK